jgi:hypothetical protein
MYIMYICPRPLMMCVWHTRRFKPADISFKMKEVWFKPEDIEFFIETNNGLLDRMYFNHG